MELNKAKLGIIAFGVVAAVFAYLDEPTWLIQMCVTGMAAAGGWELRGQTLETETWKRYYWRVLGYFISFGGFGLIADELVRGTLNFSTVGHEWYGVILFVIGLGLISKKPRGKRGV